MNQSRGTDWCLWTIGLSFVTASSAACGPIAAPAWIGASRSAGCVGVPFSWNAEA
jgi:hypothetical protein